MSWFFGKKKHKESPPDSAEETSASSQAEEYIIVERQGNPFDSNITSVNGNDGNSGAGGSGLYPYLNNIMRNPPPLPSSTSSSSSSSYEQQNILGDTQSYLGAVKFQLSKKFNDNTEIDRIHIDEIYSFLLRIKSDEYDYDFSLENSVIAEMVAATE